MKINTCNLLIKTDKDISQESNKLRGYIGNKFKNHPLLHNHYGNEKFLYSYPLVQYHILDGQAMIFGIETGGSIVDPMLNRGGVLSMSELLVTLWWQV